MAREARKRGVHGVVCGHIHHAEMREIDGMLYCNDGDWVESLTALVEHADGRLEIIDRGDTVWRPASSAAVEPARRPEPVELPEPAACAARSAGARAGCCRPPSGGERLARRLDACRQTALAAADAEVLEAVALPSAAGRRDCGRRRRWAVCMT